MAIEHGQHTDRCFHNGAFLELAGSRDSLLLQPYRANFYYLDDMDSRIVLLFPAYLLRRLLCPNPLGRMAICGHVITFFSVRLNIS